MTPTERSSITIFAAKVRLDLQLLDLGQKGDDVAFEFGGN